MWTSIRVRLETYEKLAKLKERYNTTFDGVIDMLLQEHEAIEKAGKIALLMEFAETWKKLMKLYKELEKDEEQRLKELILRMVKIKSDVTKKD